MNQILNNRLCLVPEVSVVVVTWNNLEALQLCLDSLNKAIVNSGFDTEIIVVNNGSCDGTTEFLSKNNRVRQFRFGHNAGFGPASNQGIQMARAPLVAMLNDDIVVDPDFFRPIIRHFAWPEVFAVAPLMIFDGKPLPGRSVGCFHRGLLEIEVRDDHPGEPTFTLFAGGGAGIFRRRMLIALGGFDKLYHPFYFEDLDLSYRAWKRGWVCISEPRSVVHHHHAGTIGKRFSKRYVYAIAQRNYLLFHWKNIHDSQWIMEHTGFLIKKIFWALMSFKLVEIWAVSLAVIRICPTMRARKAEILLSVLDDRSVLKKTSQNSSSS